MLKIQKTILNKRGERLFFDDVIPIEKGYLTKLDDKYGYLNEFGIEIIKPKYDKITPGSKVIILIKSTQKGFFNIENNVLVEPKYDDIQTLHINDVLKTKLNNKFGLINVNGTEITPPLYDKILDFYESVAVITLNTKHGYIRVNGEIICEPINDEVSEFEDGFGFTRCKNEYYCFNSKGEKLFCIHSENGLILANEGYHVIFDKKRKHFKFNSGIEIIESNNGFSVFNENGILINSIKYEF